MKAQPETDLSRIPNCRSSAIWIGRPGDEAPHPSLEHLRMRRNHIPSSHICCQVNGLQLRPPQCDAPADIGNQSMLTLAFPLTNLPTADTLRMAMARRHSRDRTGPHCTNLSHAPRETDGPTPDSST